MKKLLFIALIAFINLKSYGQNNPHSGFFDNKKKEKAYVSNNLERSKLTSVPTLIKYSSWQNNDWLNMFATKEKYTNNNLSEIIGLSYNLIDTNEVIVYQYDNLNRIISKVIHRRDYSINKIVPYFKTNYSYYIDQNLMQDTIISGYYNILINDWELYNKEITHTNFKGHITLEQDEIFQNSTWIIQKSIKTHYEYLNSNSNKIILKIDSTFKNSKYIPYYKAEYLYNIHEDKTDYISFHYSDKWDTTYKTKVFYDANRIPNRISEFSLDTSSMSLVEIVRTDSLIWHNYNPFDDFSNQTKLYSVIKARINNVLLNSYKLTTYFTDQYGSTENFYFIYNSTNDRWEKYLKDVYEYNSNLDIVHFIRYRFIDSIWSVYTGEKRYYQYDNTNIKEVIIATHDILSIDFENYAKYEYFDYITLNTGINTNNNTIETKLFPNPSSDGNVSINVKMERASDLKIEVLDLNGKTISSQTQNFGMGMNTIELNGLNHGLYFVVLTSDFGVSRTKLMVK